MKRRAFFTHLPLCADLKDLFRIIVHDYVHFCPFLVMVVFLLSSGEWRDRAS